MTVIVFLLKYISFVFCNLICVCVSQFYGSMCIIYLIAAIVWFGLMIYHRKELITLQVCVCTCVRVCVCACARVCVRDVCGLCACICGQAHVNLYHLCHNGH